MVLAGVGVSCYVAVSRSIPQMMKDSHCEEGEK